MKQKQFIITAITPIGTFISDPASESEVQTLVEAVKEPSVTSVTLLIKGKIAFFPEIIIKNSVWMVEPVEKIP